MLYDREHTGKHWPTFGQPLAYVAIIVSHGTDSANFGVISHEYFSKNQYIGTKLYLVMPMLANVAALRGPIVYLHINNTTSTPKATLVWGTNLETDSGTTGDNAKPDRVFCFCLYFRYYKK